MAESRRTIQELPRKFAVSFLPFGVAPTYGRLRYFGYEKHNIPSDNRVYLLMLRRQVYIKASNKFTVVGL